MKRSSQIGLTATGILLVASAWSYFGQEGEKLVYADVGECKSAGRITPEECETRFAEAEAGHMKSAKRYSSSLACEIEYGPGRCETRTVNGASVIVPAFAGMVLARALFGGNRQAEPLLPPTRQACPPGSRAEECQPASRSSGSGSSGGRGYSSGSYRSRAYTTTSGQALVASGGLARRSSSVSSRGGFGSTGRSFWSASS